MRAIVALVLALAALTAIGGACTLLDDDPPDDTCRTNADCFQAQGEVCDMGKKRCVMKVFMDAGVDAP